jgi:ethanolamine ammonia-lyase small subunit
VGNIVRLDPWQRFRRFTPARIALGCAGSSLPTAELLRFGLAHAEARDAVHLPLDVAALEEGLRAASYCTIRVHSRAPDRATYLLRPDLGRRLADDSAALLSSQASKGSDILFTVADGLSPIGVQRHALPLLRSLKPLLPAEWSLSPVVIAEQSRVALGDEIGELLGAKMVVMLIGERPGLSSPDSLGIYLIFAPKIGRTDAERNCISNIRPEGLNYASAVKKLVWLLGEARRRQHSGVLLKDTSESLELKQ